MQSVNNNQQQSAENIAGSSSKSKANPFDRFNQKDNSIQAKFSTMLHNIRAKFGSGLSSENGNNEGKFRDVVKKIDTQTSCAADAAKERNKILDQQEEDEKRAREAEHRQKQIDQDIARQMANRKEDNAKLLQKESFDKTDSDLADNREFHDEADDLMKEDLKRLRPSDILAASFAGMGSTLSAAPNLSAAQNPAQAQGSNSSSAQADNHMSSFMTGNANTDAAMKTLLAASGGQGLGMIGNGNTGSGSYSHLTSEGHGTSVENNASKAFNKMAALDGATTDQSIGSELDELNRHNLSSAGEGNEVDDLDRISNMGTRDLRANLDALARSSNVSKLSIDMANPAALATAARNAQSINNLTQGGLQAPIVGNVPNSSTMGGNAGLSGVTTNNTGANLGAVGSNGSGTLGGIGTGANGAQNANSASAFSNLNAASNRLDSSISEEGAELTANNAQRAAETANARAERNANVNSNNNNISAGIQGNTAAGGANGSTSGSTSGVNNGTNGVTNNGENNIANDTTTPSGEDGVDLRPNEVKDSAEANSLKASSNATNASNQALSNASNASSQALNNTHHAQNSGSNSGSGSTNNSGTNNGTSGADDSIVNATDSVTRSNPSLASYSDDADFDVPYSSGTTSAREALMKLAGISSNMSSEELVEQAKTQVAEFNARHNIISDRAITNSPEVANAITSLQSSIKNSDRFGSYEDSYYNTSFGDNAIENAASVVTKNTFNSLMSGQDDNHGSNHDESASLFAQGNSTNALSELRSAQASMNSFAHMAMTTSAAHNANAIHERVMEMAARNMKQLNVELTPNEMGKMRISISLDKDNQAVTVSLAAASPQTREVLEQAMPRLREALAQQNVDADTNIYDLNDDHGSNGQNQHANSDAQHQGAEGNGGFGNSNPNLQSLGLPSNRPLRASDLNRSSGDALSTSDNALAAARNIGHAFGVDGAVSNNAFKNSREDSLNGLKSVFGERGTDFAHGTMSEAVADNLTDGNHIS